MPPLPAPSPEAQAHSHALTELIAAELGQAGWMSFARYMELALHAPGLGYYSGGAAKFGASGDFVTAPEISPLFGQCLARFAQGVLTQSGGAILEVGAGTGRLAAQLLEELARLDGLPEHYFILDLSADLRERQKAALSGLGPAIAGRVRWLDRLPERFTGLMLGNELLDAMPVHLVSWQDAGLFERGVALREGCFTWEDRPLEQGALFDAANAIPVPRPYLSEIALASNAFVASAARVLEKGVLLLIDYGFGRGEYYHPQRCKGTLMCHYRHHSHDDPFYLPGLQDITAHVDFTAVAEAGIDSGLQLLGYTSQAAFLIDCGITDLLSGQNTRSADYAQRVAGAQKLLSPAEMGELFKALALGKGLESPLPGFRHRDLRRLL